MQLDQSTFYQIRVKGHLDGTMASWFDDLTVSSTEGGESVLSGSLPDQSALQGMLNRISNLGLTLISVNAVPEKDSESKRRNNSE